MHYIQHLPTSSEHFVFEVYVHVLSERKTAWSSQEVFWLWKYYWYAASQDKEAHVSRVLMIAAVRKITKGTKNGTV